ncbi:MAG: Spy/CpxP family protein refolding chaperone [Pseudomonadota bacterium]
MKSLKNKFFIGLTALTMAAGAYAQSSSAPAASAPATARHGQGGMDHAQSVEKMQERMARHQAQLHDKLKLTAAQEPAWKTFVASMTPSSMPAREDRKALAKLSTPELMEKHLQMMKEHQARMEARLADLKTFYAVLTPEQQKVFDEAHRHMHAHHGQWQQHDGAKPAEKKQ